MDHKKNDHCLFIMLGIPPPPYELVCLLIECLLPYVLARMVDAVSPLERGWFLWPISDPYP